MSELAAKDYLGHATHEATMHTSSGTQIRKESFHPFEWGIGGHRKCTLRLANTYRLAPERHERFAAHVAERIVREVLRTFLEGERYQRALCASLCAGLADTIKGKAKEQGWSERYKYVCLVTLGQRKAQGLIDASRCLWDPLTDSFASASYSNGDLFASATLFALYRE